MPVVFGVILGTGVVYGLAAKPIAKALRVVKPQARGVGLVGHDPWLLDLGARLHELGASVVVVTSQPPEAARAAQNRSGVPVLSLADTEATVRGAVLHADVGQAALCAPANTTLDLLDAHLIGTMGRRKVFRLPDSRRTGALGRRVLAGRSAHPFGPGVTLQDVEARVDAGAAVKVIDQPPSDVVLPLAAVGPDGAVNLQPGAQAPGPDDTVIGLVGSPTGDAQSSP